MHNILVTGKNGQLGSELQALSSEYPYQFFFTDRDSLDISDKVAIETFIRENNIQFIINAAAYTAVDKAEEESALADEINHKSVKVLGELVKKYAISLVHVSTDYVFDGKNYRPYVEEDPVAPQGIYGESKLKGEQALEMIDPENTIIIRTSWVYSSFGQNFVKTMLRLGKERESLGVIFDQVGTPTYAKDLAKMILDIIPKIDNEHVEIYHYSNEGVLSWYDFAKEIMSLAHIECQVSPIETTAYPTPASRPHYSLMNKEKIKRSFEIKIPYWKESLQKCLLTLGEIK